MPELPEVETVARMIAPGIRGRTIEGVRVLWERSLGGATRAAFGRAVRGARIAGVRRRGKYVIVELRRKRVPAGAVVVHLRMSGRLMVDRARDENPRWLRVALRLSGGRQLRFVDVRKFGRFTFARDADAFLDHLGPEPLDPGFTEAVFTAALRGRRATLKPLLLDQTFVAGLGNIYVDESLHRAGLHPECRSDRVTRARAQRLHVVLQTVLSEAIEREGSSFDPFYRTPEGNPGSYQHLFRVYGREGEPCTTCGRAIKRIVVGQRGTHLCTRCQPKPRGRKRAQAPRTTIRRAVVSDAPALGSLHVRAWQHAYRGQMPQAYLDRLDAKTRAAHHEKWIRRTDVPDRRIWVLVRGGDLLGFAVSGPARDDDLSTDVGEVYAIYVEPSVIGTGLGRRLYSYTLMGLRRLGFRGAVVWVLDKNMKTHRFYEAAGFARDGSKKTLDFEGQKLIEIRFRGAL